MERLQLLLECSVLVLPVQEQGLQPGDVLLVPRQTRLQLLDPAPETRRLDVHAHRPPPERLQLLVLEPELLRERLDLLRVPVLDHGRVLLRLHLEPLLQALVFLHSCITYYMYNERSTAT